MSFKYSLFTVLCFIVLICFGVYFLFFYNSYRKKDINEVAQILGLSEVSILSSDYSFDPFTIQDYDLMEVYQLSYNSVHDFMLHSSFKLHDKFCASNSITSLAKKDWHKSPIDSIKWQETLSMVLGLRENEKRNKWLAEMRGILFSDYGYYALYFTDKEIAFYVLDTMSGKLYISYLNP